MSIAVFQLLSKGKIKAITKKQYQQRLGRKGYTVGYTDGDFLLFSRNWEVIILKKKLISEIYDLPKDTELP